MVEVVVELATLVVEVVVELATLVVEVVVELAKVVVEVVVELSKVVVEVVVELAKVVVEVVVELSEVVVEVVVELAKVVANRPLWTPTVGPSPQHVSSVQKPIPISSLTTNPPRWSGLTTSLSTPYLANPPRPVPKGPGSMARMPLLCWSASEPRPH